MHATGSHALEGASVHDGLLGRLKVYWPQVSALLQEPSKIALLSQPDETSQTGETCRLCCTWQST